MPRLRLPGKEHSITYKSDPISAEPIFCFAEFHFRLTSHLASVLYKPLRLIYTYISRHLRL